MPPRESAGGIVLNQDGKMALVHQRANSWSFPKGGIEEGENALQAAKREIAEETGLTDLTLVKELGTYERYSIGQDGVGEQVELGLRKRTLFLFTITEGELKPQDKEVTNACWVTFDEALALLTHPKDKEFLTSVRDILKEWKSV
jgi:bis(5'-nucleosidyl)-tetraphosphatase